MIRDVIGIFRYQTEVFENIKLRQVLVTESHTRKKLQQGIRGFRKTNFLSVRLCEKTCLKSETKY